MSAVRANRWIVAKRCVLRSTSGKPSAHLLLPRYTPRARFLSPSLAARPENGSRALVFTPRRFYSAASSPVVHFAQRSRGCRKSNGDEGRSRSETTRRYSFYDRLCTENSNEDLEYGTIVLTHIRSPRVRRVTCGDFHT